MKLELRKICNIRSRSKWRVAVAKFLYIFFLFISSALFMLQQAENRIDSDNNYYYSAFFAPLVQEFQRKKTREKRQKNELNIESVQPLAECIVHTTLTLVHSFQTRKIVCVF